MGQDFFDEDLQWKQVRSGRPFVDDNDDDDE